jgi:hypothetical protein
MTYIVNPSFALFRQLSGSQRQHRVVKLEVVREEAEEIDQPEISGTLMKMRATYNSPTVSKLIDDHSCRRVSTSSKK